MRTVILFLLLAAVVHCVSAQSPTEPAPAAPAAEAPAPLSEEETAKIAEKFAHVKKDFEGRKKEIATSALGRFSSAAMSEGAAAQFYLECERVLEDRKPDLDGTTKQDAKDRADRAKQQGESIMDTPGYGAVLQMQLQFLVFTMEATNMKDRGMIIARMKDFVNKATNMVQAYTLPTAPTEKPEKQGGNSKGGSKKSQGGGGRKGEKDQRHDDRSRHQVVQLAQRGVMSSMFAQAYSLQSYFKPIEGWPQSPLDLPGIYQGMLLPWYRQNKPELLAAEWDNYINSEAAIQRCGLDDNGYARWLIGAYKSLQWEKWKDLLVNGKNHVLAADELSKLCKENPNHPSMPDWVEELDKLAASFGGGTAAPPK